MIQESIVNLNTELVWLYSFIRVLIRPFLHSIDMHGLKTEWGLEP